MAYGKPSIKHYSSNFWSRVLAAGLLTLIVVGRFALAGQRNAVDVLADWRGCQQGDCARDLIERCRCHVIILSVGLMPTEARGNYLPEPPYLRETKTYLNSMHASESTLDNGTASHSSRHDMLVVISSRYQYGPFLFFLLQKFCQIT